MSGFGPNVPQKPIARQAQVREIPIPIQGAAWPSLKAAFPMTATAWQQMIDVLNAMKAGLVEAPADQEPATETKKPE